MPTGPGPPPLTVWVEAARPKTLTAALTPVLVGTAAAATVIAWLLAAALAVALAVQVGVNYANDYFDAVKGVDTAARVGPRRAVASGLISARQMRTAMLAALAVAGVAGAALAAAAGWQLLVVGVLCFAAALGYSGGPRPYASAGLGEAFVFVFFGLVATVGSAYVQVERILPVAVAAAVPVGLLATAILVANNLRDLDTDRDAGKHTLAVRLGDRRTRGLYTSLVVGAFSFVAVVAVAAASAWPLLALAALPLALRPLAAVRAAATGPRLVVVLAGTARLELGFGLLLAVGLVLG
ncbi:MAG: 1,4-dihydroxy-2-naphthoate polyprenyltransferase [Actinomycetota bacterium]|nr:1,4-dihydroxy-2-naphthoate polyprenyltransferase [Actinomycetota bacterium]